MTTKRYFKIDTAGPTYTVCAESPARALIAWAHDQISLGYEDTLGEEETPLPDSIAEIVPSNLVRCAKRSPDGRGLTWYLSGGSPLSYRACCLAGCPRATQPQPAPSRLAAMRADQRRQ